MRKIPFYVLLIALTAALLVGCSDDETYKPVITRIESNVACGYPPVDVQFVVYATGGDPQDDPTGANTNLSIDWDFDDGDTGSGSIVSHRYLDPGEYEVFATVTDDDGDVARASLIVELKADSLSIQASNDTTVTASMAYFDTPTLGSSNGSGGSYFLDHLVINEILAFNESTIMNPVNSQYEPLIELYNPTDETIELNGWSLTTEYSTPDMWSFEGDLTIAPGGFLIIWVDGREAAGNTHTSFELTDDWDGEPEDFTTTLYLFNPSEIEIHRVLLLNQHADVSFGFLPDACSDGMVQLNLVADICGFDSIDGLYERFDFDWDMDDVLGSVYHDHSPRHIYSISDVGEREIVVRVFDTFTSVTRHDTVMVQVALPE